MAKKSVKIVKKDPKGEKKLPPWLTKAKDTKKKK